jgi:hypothetical protein
MAARRCRNSREPLAFRLQGRLSKRCELAVDPVRIPCVALGGKARRDHAVERVFFDLLDDVVAVALPPGEGEEDREDRLRERPLGWTWSCAS